MLAFQKEGNQYAGVAFGNLTFERAILVCCRSMQVTPSEVEHVVQYIGRGIVIPEKEE
jgi:hypothetical protein